VIGIPEGKSMYDTEAVKDIKDARNLPFVGIPLPRMSRKERRTSKERESGSKMRERKATVFSGNGTHYNDKFHLAVSRMGMCDRNLPGAKHPFCDFLKPDGKGRFFVADLPGGCTRYGDLFFGIFYEVAKKLNASIGTELSVTNEEEVKLLHSCCVLLYIVVVLLYCLLHCCCIVNAFVVVL
jgi:hypothetical protein